MKGEHLCCKLLYSVVEILIKVCAVAVRQEKEDAIKRAEEYLRKVAREAQ